jgi:hypothetical protein
MDAEKPYSKIATSFPVRVSQTSFSCFGQIRLLLVGLAVFWACFSASAGQSVTLGWDANEAEPGVLGGYRLYYGTASRQYTLSNWVDASQTTSRVSNLIEGVTYYFAVTAVTVDDLESDYSAEITYQVPSASPPAVGFTDVDFAAPPPPPATSPGLIQTEEVVDLGSGVIGSHPNLNSGPRLDIAPYGQPVVGYCVGFEAPAGKACELQVSNDLIVWQKLFYRGTQALAERLEFYDFPGEAKTRRYYRVAVW